MNDPDLRDPRLDRAYRETPRDEPPPELDERIRAAARRAVSAGPQSLEERAGDERRRSWTSRWRLPLSVAATVVVAVTLTLMMNDEDRYRAYDTAPAAAPAAAPPSPEAARAPATVPAQDATPPASAPESRRSDNAAARAAPPATPAPVVPAPVAAEPAPKREERAVEMPQRPAADAVGSAPVELRQRAPALSAPAVPAPAPPPAARERELMKVAPQTAPAGAASDTLSRDRALGDRPARATRETGVGAIRTPEAWLEQIRSLRAQGREAEAATELAEFRRAYPDFRLPPDLAR